ncbi:hypothetical protein CKO31_01300 [Thiohalocapsa halophila]|uniref:PIN domain-containing protein n=1 Tax=Thiohalocapsa halophila TaxID=69359 RepID=A0ABS1CBT9_9GAMM|nr:hypothetical protein [Thiohalocapsa halophila]MBK1629391.1 hypothetical protein [Thiohalocapsa halophila]
MSETVVLDACCLINLAAADALDTWLGGLGLAWMLPEAVLHEALFLRGGDAAAGEAETADATEPVRERLMLEPYIAGGLLTIVQPQTDAELAAYVDLARELDDGEAMALAIAQRRGWQLATDDRKAIRLADDARVPVLTTPTVVRRWADQLDPSAADLRAALTAIRDRARFLPSGRDPLCDWWMAQLRT